MTLTLHLHHDCASSYVVTARIARIDVMIMQAASFLHLLACNQALCAHEVNVTVSSFVQEYPSSAAGLICQIRLDTTPIKSVYRTNQ